MGLPKESNENECYMINRNISDFGLWKYGKGRASNHIPTNFLILIETYFFKITSKKREKTIDRLSSLNRK